jgi:hypothetical protein
MAARTGSPPHTFVWFFDAAAVRSLALAATDGTSLLLAAGTSALLTAG